MAAPSNSEARRLHRFWPSRRTVYAREGSGIVRVARSCRCARYRRGTSRSPQSCRGRGGRMAMTYFSETLRCRLRRNCHRVWPRAHGLRPFRPGIPIGFLDVRARRWGFVSSLGFFGFFLGFDDGASLADRGRGGPRPPVLSGPDCGHQWEWRLLPQHRACPVLALGVFLTASSAGLRLDAPFNDAVHRKVWDVDRPTALSRIAPARKALVSSGAGAAALIMSC